MSSSGRRGLVSRLFRRQGSTARDILTISSSTILAQLIGIAASPVLSRLFPPETYGAAAVFLSLTSIVTTVSCLRYELAIMLPERDEEAANLLVLGLVVSLAVTAIVAALLASVGGPFLNLFNASELAPYLPLVIVSVAAGGVGLAMNYWNTRRRRFANLAYSRTSGSLATAGTQIVGGLAGQATAGMQIVAISLGSWLSSLVMAIRVLISDRKMIREAFSIQEMRRLAVRYRKFPLLNTWSSLLNVLSWQLPTILLSRFFSPTIVGFYALGYRVLRMPMNLLGQAVGQVYFQRAAESKHRGEIGPLVYQTFRRLVSLGMFPFLMLTVMGREAFALVYGPAWSEAGVFSQILGIWTFFWFISSPISNLYSVLEKQEQLLAFNVVLLVTRFLSIVGGGLTGDPRIALLLFSASGTVLYAYLALSIMRKAGVGVGKALLLVARYAALFLPFGLPVVLLKVLGAADVTVVCVALAGAGGYYAIVLMRERRKRVQE